MSRRRRVCSRHSLSNRQFGTLTAEHLYLSVDELADVPYNVQDAAGLEVRFDLVDEVAKGRVTRFRHRGRWRRYVARFCPGDDGRVGCGAERSMIECRCVRRDDCVVGMVYSEHVCGRVSICPLSQCHAERLCRITAGSSIGENDRRVTVKVSSRQSHAIGTGVACRNLGVCCI